MEKLVDAANITAIRNGSGSTSIARASEIGIGPSSTAVPLLLITSVSKAVAALEAELEVRLFNRTSRHVALTPEGEVYLRHCRDALDRLKEVMLAGETPPKELDYGEEYGRIWTKVEIGQPQDGFAYACVLHVRWQEKGEAFNAASTKDKEGFSRFDFFLVRTPRGL